MQPKLVKPAWRFIVGVILLIILALYSGWQSIQYYDIQTFLHRYEKYGTVASDSISRLENDLACLKGELSPDEPVGFVSPLPRSDWGEAYHWTQYALAPIIVTGDLTLETLVAYYPGEKNLERAAAQGYEILLDCHNGVGLLTTAKSP